MIRNNFYENNTRSVLPSEQEKFVKFQCRARQMIMRDNFGKPDDSIMPNLYLDKQKEPICKIITLIHKLPEFSLLTELKHIAKKLTILLKEENKQLGYCHLHIIRKIKNFQTY